MRKCSRCKLGKSSHQVCCFRNVLYIRVRVAEEILKECPRRRVKLSLRKLKGLVKLNRINKTHTNHVNLKSTPILGQTNTHIFTIDGSHRIGWHVINKKPMYVYILNAFETGLISEPRPPKGKRFVKI